MSVSISMNYNEAALARSRAYHLFSQLFIDGLTDDLASILGEIPELAAHLPDSVQTNEIKAEHYHLFGLNVFPYETIFLDTDGLLGGQHSETVAGFYHEIGFRPSERDNADHIGIELSALALLCGAEADAHDDNLIHEAQRMRHFQRRLLDEHLLRWLPGLTHAIQQQGDGLYAALANLTLNLVLDHRSELGDDVMNLPPVFKLAEMPDLLGHEKTSLKDIAGYLLVPSYTGFYLSRDDIGRMGDAFQLPRGFGPRQQMLTNLMRTAVDYDALQNVLEALQQLCGRWQDFYARIEGQEQVINIWQQRIANTQTLLSEIQQAAQQQLLELEEAIESES